MTNVDPGEIAKFSELAHHWWNPAGDFKPLHDINPLRLDYIDARVGLKGTAVLDVGCGGGILAESMAIRGAQVTGIDLADKPLMVAETGAVERNPGEMIARVGADALRLFMLFLGPPQAQFEWKDEGLDAAWRYLNRAWRAVSSSADGRVLVAGTNGAQLYVSTDYGVTWTPRATATSNCAKAMP